MKEEFLKELGNRIFQKREKKKMSRTELARLTNKEYRSILRLEKGEINCSLFYLCEIADGLGIAVDDLVKKLPS